MKKSIRSKANRGNCLFYIMLYVIELLVERGILIPLESNKGIKARLAHNEPINGYFRVACIPNLVWMHVQDGYGVFINERITTRSGKVIDLVKELSKYYWYIDNSTNTVRCGGLSNRSIARCIGSIIMFGDIKHKLPKCWEMHHKWWRWCNTQETIVVVCKKDHKKFHDCVNSRKSHRQGVAIYDADALKNELEVIKYNQNYWKGIPM